MSMSCENNYQLDSYKIVDHFILCNLLYVYIAMILMQYCNRFYYNGGYNNQCYYPLMCVVIYNVVFVYIMMFFIT